MMLSAIKRVVESRSRGVLAAVALVAIGVASTGAAQAPAGEPATAGAPPSLRVISQSQYRQIVADLFGPDISITGRFEPGQRPANGRLLAIGTSTAGISAAGFEQYEAIARGVTAQVVDAKHREALLPCQVAEASAFDAACAGQIVNKYGPLLYRRALRPGEAAGLVATAKATHGRLGDFYSAMAATLTAMMVQPDFLLRGERIEADPAGGVRLDGYAKASRLSFLLTNAAPDGELLRAAGAGELNTPAGLTRQVDRLMASPRLEQGVRAFFADMLAFEQFDQVQKDATIYPDYSARVAADAQEQTMRTIVDHVVAQKADYRDLFTTRKTYLTRTLGGIYLIPVASRNGWEAAEYPADSGRSGILTDISFLALWSHPGRSSPTIRGKMLGEIFLCRTVPPPPGDVDFTLANNLSDPKLKTARQRLNAHVVTPSCKGCHQQMDPMGLPFETFDSIGAFRTVENGAPIDTSGQLGSRSFADAAGLGQAMHDNPAVPNCLADNLYRYGVGRNFTPSETALRDYLRTDFQASGYKVTSLLRTIALSKAFYAVTRPDAAPTRTASLTAPHSIGDK